MLRGFFCACRPLAGAPGACRLCDAVEPRRRFSSLFLIPYALSGHVLPGRALPGQILSQHLAGPQANQLEMAQTAMNDQTQTFALTRSKRQRLATPATSTNEEQQPIMDKYDFYDEYEAYEARFQRQAHGERRQRQNGSRKATPAVPVETVEPAAPELELDPFAFDPTYMRDKKEDNQERMWVIQHLQGFYEEEYITDVLYNVKSGKEASVYVCTAHETLGAPYVAAKIYRPAIFRSLKNDAAYREGRYSSREQGQRAADLLDGRTARAIEHRTGFGKQVMLNTWIGHEYQMMRKLYEAGVHIPEPIGHKGHAILMEYLGEGRTAAPPLHYIRLDKDQAQGVFDQLWQDVVLMLAHDVIHGDFSAYNVLYWDGKATIIDFPQAVDPWYNANGLALLERDITRLCQYFARYRVVGPDGAPPDALALTHALWTRYMDNDLL